MKLYTPFNSNFITNHITIKNYIVKERNIIFNQKFFHCFSSFIKYNDLYYLFSTDEKDDFKIMPQTVKCLYSKDGINFNIDTDFLLKYKAVCNNFTIINHDNNFIAIGGRHCEKVTQEMHNKINCICANNNYHPRLKPPYDLDNNNNQFYNNGHGTLPFINDNFQHKCFMNGIYCFSGNKINNLNLIHDKPIISGFNDGIIDRVFGATTFDSQNSLLFNKKNKLYFFYCRSNHRKNGRSIQYSTSQDLINWDSFKYINNPSFNVLTDNYYSPNFFLYPNSDFYIGIITSHTTGNNTSELKLLYSNDCIRWTNISNILTFGGGEHYLFDKNIAHSGLVLSPSQKEFYLYVQHGYKNGGYWHRYSIRKDGFQSFYNNNNHIGIVEFNNMIFTNTFFKINYKTFEHGYIILKFINPDIIFDIKLTGDEVDKIINLQEQYQNKEFNIKISICNAELFSITI